MLGTGPRDIYLIAGGKIAGIRDLRGRERPLDARRAAGGRAPAHHGARRRHVLDVGRPREPEHRAAGHLERGIEADVGARRDVLVHLDGDHVVAVDERARGDGEGEQEGLVRAGHGGRGRRRVEDRGDRHVRARDLVAVEVDDRAVVALELELERGDRPDVAHREDPAEVGGDVVAGGAGRRARAAVHDGGFAAVAIAELGRALRPAAVGEGRRAPGSALVAAVVEVAPGRAQRDQEVAHALGQRRRRRGERPQAEDPRDHDRADGRTTSNLHGASPWAEAGDTLARLRLELLSGGCGAPRCRSGSECCEGVRIGGSRRLGATAPFENVCTAEQQRVAPRRSAVHAIEPGERGVGAAGAEFEIEALLLEGGNRAERGERRVRGGECALDTPRGFDRRDPLELDVRARGRSDLDEAPKGVARLAPTLEPGERAGVREKDRRLVRSHLASDAQGGLGLAEALPPRAR